MEEKITNQGGVQENLNELATLELFGEIMEEVVRSKGLVLEDVERCVQYLYINKEPTLTHGNSDEITIREEDFVPNEYAALIAFLKLHGQWTPHFNWKEEKKKAKEQKE